MMNNFFFTIKRICLGISRVLPQLGERIHTMKGSVYRVVKVRQQMEEAEPTTDICGFRENSCGCFKSIN